ncbi:hypothetical protein [Rhodococcus aetherivorans]|uniref:hypothetical protein n=1 Tax=Rhodococcus aetherivorans TaxID=191292 RepID=UPI003890B2FD
MSTPGGSAPDGSWQWGSRGNYTDDADEAMSAATGGAMGGITDSIAGWDGVVDDLADLANQVRDGQLDMNDRLDLLESVAGYCQLFMSKNWRVKGGSYITLPFDAQIGPNKGAVPHQNGIRLSKKGLWRVAAHVSFYPPPANWFTGASAVGIDVVISVVTTTGVVYSEEAYPLVVTSLGSETAAFAHTLVVPTDEQYVATVKVKHPKDWAWIYGGTLRSSLTANKWDNGTDNAVVLPVAPDGGELTGAPA